MVGGKRGNGVNAVKSFALTVSKFLLAKKGGGASGKLDLNLIRKRASA